MYFKTFIKIFLILKSGKISPIPPICPQNRGEISLSHIFFFAGVMLYIGEIGKIGKKTRISADLLIF